MASSSSSSLANCTNDQEIPNIAQANDHPLENNLMPPYLNILPKKMPALWAGLNNILLTTVWHGHSRPLHDWIKCHNLDYEYGYDHGSTNDHAKTKVNIRSWKFTISLITIQFLEAFRGPLGTIGRFIEWFLNFMAFNGGRLVLDILLLRFDRIIWSPPKDSPRYYSFIGWLDPRQELLDDMAGHQSITFADQYHTNTRSFVDLAMMTAKLAYESEHVQKNVVNNVWKMNFKKSYTFWNDRLQENTTHAFAFTEKITDANIIFLAFRGTEPFNAINWAVDFDFSFVQLDVGRVHVGFLEALGLVNREQPDSFAFFKQNCEDMNSNASWGPSEGPDCTCITGIRKTDANETKELAFDVLTKELWGLLHENPNAKLFVSGHSLGGALTLLFVGILMYKQRNEKENEILKRLCSVHTFGQPRICDGLFSDFMAKNFEKWNIDFYRIVYNNDIVSRVPFDDHIFNFKHVGHSCYYYNSCFHEKNLASEPNKNFFSWWYVVPMWLNAIWELLQGLFLGKWLYGKEYTEGILTIIIRVVGLILPGVSSHLPVNYVHAIRLGPAILVKNNLD